MDVHQKDYRDSKVWRENHQNINFRIFFILQEKFQVKFQQAQDRCYIICIPQRSMVDEFVLDGHFVGM